MEDATDEARYSDKASLSVSEWTGRDRSEHGGSARQECGRGIGK